MLTKTQYQAIYDWIPSSLAGESVPKVRGSQFAGQPSFPCLVVSGPQTSTRARYNGSLVRTEWNEADDVYDETEGYNMFSTIRVDVEALNEDDATDITAALVTSLYETRHDLSWDDYHVKFSVMQNAGYEANYNYPIQGGSGTKKIYRRVVEFRVEYEMSWQVVAPPMKEFDTTIDDDGATVVGQIRYELAED